MTHQESGELSIPDTIQRVLGGEFELPPSLGAGVRTLGGIVLETWEQGQPPQDVHGASPWYHRERELPWAPGVMARVSADPTGEWNYTTLRTLEARISVESLGNEIHLMRWLSIRQQPQEERLSLRRFTPVRNTIARAYGEFFAQVRPST
jgi:hypothetical protein